MHDSIHGIGESRTRNWVASLRDFVNEPASRAEHCALCNDALGPEHAHLVELDSGRLLCSCTPCALLFSSPEAKRYRRVPGKVERLSGFQLSDAQWDAFLIPIRLAFFVPGSKEGGVRVLYPGAAGAAESTSNVQAWKDLVEANPLLEELEHDVEALLVNRIGDTRAYFRVPIDRCYELVGLIRSRWHGLSGGEGVQDAIRSFFAKLNEDAIEMRGATDA